MTDINTQKLLKLAPSTLLCGIRSLGAKLSADGDHLAYAGAPTVLTDELLSLISARKSDLIVALESQPERRQKPPVVSQSMEEFIIATWGKVEVDTPRGDLPPTQKQLDILRRGNCFDIFKTRREASDRIGELIASGALCDFLSLEELEAFDRRAPGHSRNRRRFCCPLCGDSKPLDANHRSLNVDMTDGLYYCHRCGAKGKLREYLGDAGTVRVFTHTPPTKEPTDDRWKKRWAFAQPIRGTDGAKYLERRGVPTDIAEAAGVRFGRWFHDGEPFNGVIFPVRDAGGKLIAAQARAIVGDIKNTRGPKSLGVFFTTPGRSRRIAITEAPIDALVLAAAGLPAVALLGTTWPEWLPAALAGRDVALATDADRAGDECAGELGAPLIACASVWRLRPVGAKDWAGLAERDGLDAVREAIMNATEYAPEVAA